MAQEDKERWDKKYQNKDIPDVPIRLIQDHAQLSPGKQALDIACGMGRHSKYLVSQGFEVEALDISSVAISQLQNLEHIVAKEVDLDSYILDKEKYDLIICVYFLKRSLFMQMIDALKPNGIIIIETFLHDPGNERAPSNPDFLLNEGELEAAFEDRCELLHIKEYEERNYQGYKSKKIQMVARKKVL
jgi:2-polyprenyl-3-methyl-5-hydroxy-6-metoxy-1,4-benzoquinol methylase